MAASERMRSKEWLRAWCNYHHFELGMQLCNGNTYGRRLQGFYQRESIDPQEDEQVRID